MRKSQRLYLDKRASDNNIKKDVKLFNMIFPMWMLWIFPPFFLICAAANFIIDSAVVLISNKILKFPNVFKKYRKCILLVWIFGFLADIVGGIYLFGISQLIDLFHNFGDSARTIAWGISYNPFGHPLAFLITCTSIVLSGYLIFLFNYKISLNKLDINQKQKKQLAIILALVTAPYLFLLPIGLF